LQVPPAQDVEPSRVVTPPFGPTTAWCEEQLPPPQLPLPLELQVRPCGPTPLPERTQPASASVEVAANEQAASASVPATEVRLRFMIQSPHRLLTPSSDAGRETGMRALPGYFRRSARV
jgi:hypothetical protein